MKYYSYYDNLDLCNYYDITREDFDELLDDFIFLGANNVIRFDSPRFKLYLEEYGKHKLRCKLP
jgi:hypothetical protein